MSHSRDALIILNDVFSEQYRDTNTENEIPIKLTMKFYHTSDIKSKGKSFLLEYLYIEKRFESTENSWEIRCMLMLERN